MRPPRTVSFCGEANMILLKGVLLGLGISLAGSVLFIAYWMHRSLQQARQYYPEGEIGFDIGSSSKG
jgi:hypothetical protein